MPEGHLVSAFPLCQPCSTPQGQAESGGMVLVAYAGSVHPAAALRDSVLCLPTDIHSLLVNKTSSSTTLCKRMLDRDSFVAVNCHIKFIDKLHSPPATNVARSRAESSSFPASASNN